jgi:hypothetical protein
MMTNVVLVMYYVVLIMYHMILIMYSLDHDLDGDWSA